MIIRFFKFGFVGISGMVIDFSITFLLKEKLKIHRYLASSIGFITAATSNWFFNRLWTFQSSNPRIIVEYGTFVMISIVGLAINNAFLYLFEKRLKFYAAKLFATGVTMAWNFLANYYITFAR